MGVKYHHIDGCIFKGKKQLMVVVAVEISRTKRNALVDILVDILNRKEPPDVSR
jgi:hypothetical protein